MGRAFKKGAKLEFFSCSCFPLPALLHTHSRPTPLMRHSYLPLLFALSVLGPASAHFLDNTPNPSATFSTYPPGKPTAVPEPDQDLEPGHRYADPHENPFNQPNAFVYGPVETVEDVAHNFTYPGTIDDDQCQPRVGTFEQRWSAYHHEIFHLDNQTVQHVGFAPEILKKLETNDKSVAGEVTRSQQILYGCEKDDWMDWRDGDKGGHDGNHTGHDDGHDKRVILGADTRVEDLNTWLFPWSVIGEVGGKCTGKDFLHLSWRLFT
jgi:hypothetical protein